MILRIIQLMLLIAIAWPATADKTILIPDHIVMSDGSLAESYAVIIENGKIVDIVSEDDVSEDGAAIVQRLGGVLSPGLIDINTTIAVNGDNFADRDVIDSEIATIDAVDRESRDLRRALEAGVTATLITPSPINVITGRTAVIRTHQPDNSSIALQPFGPLAVVLSSSSWSPNREPSSRAGAMALIRRALDDAKNNDSADEQLKKLVAGKADAIVTCETAQDVSSALRLMTPLGVTPVIVHTRDVIDIAEEIADADATVVVGPYGFSTSTAVLIGAETLERSGATLAFSSGAPGGDPDGLRITANLAVQNGLSPENARRALTVNAAEAADVADQVGAIEVGLAADLVLFSGDPLRLDSDVLTVWIAGQPVYAADASNTQLFDQLIGATDE